MTEPLSPTEAKAAILAILKDGLVIFSKHARDEMKKDRLADEDAINVLRAGVVDPAEQERGTWRYRVRTSRMCFVVAFQSDTALIVVTGWRIR